MVQKLIHYKSGPTVGAEEVKPEMKKVEQMNR